MARYRIDMAFYVEADSEEDALLAVKNGISFDLAGSYDYLDSHQV